MVRSKATTVVAAPSRRRRAATLELVPEEQPQEIVFDLERAIATMSEESVQCRDYGHPWRPFTARWLPKERHFQQTLKCPRCGTDRLRYIGKNGQLLQSHYEYPEGYLIKGMGRLDSSGRDQIRLASLQVLLRAPQEVDSK